MIILAIEKQPVTPRLQHRVLKGSRQPGSVRCLADGPPARLEDSVHFPQRKCRVVNMLQNVIAYHHIECFIRIRNFVHVDSLNGLIRGRKITIHIQCKTVPLYKFPQREFGRHLENGAAPNGLKDIQRSRNRRRWRSRSIDEQWGHPKRSAFDPTASTLTKKSETSKP